MLEKAVLKRKKELQNDPGLVYHSPVEGYAPDGTKIVNQFLPKNLLVEALKADIQQMNEEPPSQGDWQTNFAGYLAKIQEENPEGYAEAETIMASGSRGPQYSRNPGIVSRFNRR